MADEEQAIAELVPRVRRAVEGPKPLESGDPDRLEDDDLKLLVADSIAAVILYTGGSDGLFGKKLLVKQVDPDSNVPTEYAVSPPLSLVEQTVIANQAALDFFFHEWKNRKISESIGDEAQTWDYALSAQLTRDQMQSLIAERDRALDALSEEHALEGYVSLIAARDVATSLVIEPWVATLGTGGLVALDGWSL